MKHFFKFNKHEVDFNTQEESTNSIYLLNENNKIVTDGKEAKRFIVKRRHSPGNWKEFFGVINDYEFDEDKLARLDLPILDESAYENYYQKYQLGEEIIMNENKKSIPLFIPENFLDLSPNCFAGVTRTKEYVAQMASFRREKIHKHYLGMNPSFVQTLSDVDCNSVAYLYELLNPGQVWKIGTEYAGYVDGLWVVGSHLTVSIDTLNFDNHTNTHELGHSVSYYLINELFNEYYQLVVSLQENPISDYAMSECSEDFAESFGFYFKNKSERNFLQQHCPKRFALMQKVESLGDKALIKPLIPTKELTQRFALYDKVVY